MFLCLGWVGHVENKPESHFSCWLQSLATWHKPSFLPSIPSVGCTPLLVLPLFRKTGLSPHTTCGEWTFRALFWSGNGEMDHPLLATHSRLSMFVLRQCNNTMAWQVASLSPDGWVGQLQTRRVQVGSDFFSNYSPSPILFYQIAIKVYTWPDPVILVRAKLLLMPMGTLPGRGLQDAVYR